MTNTHTPAIPPFSGRPWRSSGMPTYYVSLDGEDYLFQCYHDDRKDITWASLDMRDAPYDPSIARRISQAVAHGEIPEVVFALGDYAFGAELREEGWL